MMSGVKGRPIMKKVLLSSLIMFLTTTAFALDEGKPVSQPEERRFVVEWEAVSPNDINIPKLSITQLLNETKRSFQAQQAIHSWEAKYNMTSRQAPQKLRDEKIPEVIISSKVHIVSNHEKWHYTQQQETKTTKHKSVVNTHIISNGETISMVWPDRKEGMVQGANLAVSVGHSTLTNFLPSLPSGLRINEKTFPKVLDIIESSNTKLLSWYARVDNQICYVLELKTKLQHPLFRNIEEVERWKAANPKEAEAWSKAARQGLVISTDSRAKPDETCKIDIKFRLAIAPKLNFSIVRWAFGYETNRGYFRERVFPHREINYSDFLEIGKNLFIPQQMIYTKYYVDYQGQGQVHHEDKLLLEEFLVDRQYNPEFFEVHFPVGYSVVDADRKISVCLQQK
jgi:hypothetical protein